jgi:hypothetical protein
MQKFLEGNQIVAAIIPVDLGTAANDGDWFNMKNFRRALAVLFKGIGTAGQDPIFTLRQATDATGANAKALTFTEIWKKVGTQTGIGQFTKVTQAAANTYVDDVSAEAQAILAVEILAEQLDVANGFTHIQLQIPDVGAAAQIGCGFYLGLDPAYAGETSLTAID